MAALRVAGFRVLAVGLSTLATLIAAEVLVRVMDVGPSYGQFRYETDVTGISPGVHVGARPPVPFAPGTWLRERAWRGSFCAFDACYSIDESGLRAQPRDARPDADAVAIFGDSHAFGVGVGDDETAAWRLAEQTGFHVVNFGRAGYGPHHVLASLQGGGERRWLAGHAVRAGYLLAFADPLRPAGRRTWDHTVGPRYTLGPDGRPVLAGTFESSPSLRLIWRLRSRSRLVERLDDVVTSIRGRRLWVAIADEARRVFEGRYHAPFTVLLTTSSISARSALVADVTRAGLRTIDFSAEAARCGAASKAVWLPDGHATPYGQVLVAQRLVEDLRETAALPLPR